MKSIKRLLLGIALILIAIWGIMCVLLVMRRLLLILAFLVLVAGIVFVFLGFFTSDEVKKSKTSEELPPEN